MEEENKSGGRCFHSKVPMIVLGIVLTVAVASIAIVSIIRDRIVNYPQNQVSVIGQGKVSYQPDIATVNLGVQIDKVAKADEALNQLNSKIKNIVAAVKGQGIAPEDITTQNYSLLPQYDYVNNVSSVSGYNANQQIIIKIRGIKDNPEKVSQVISEATKSGVNQVLGINFDVANLDELKQEARLKAIKDAGSKAGTIASAAGVKLGEVIGWWENYVQGPSSSGYYSGAEKGGLGGAGMSAGSASPTIPSGSLEIIMEMNLNYKLK